jgi:hypothetical protein
MFQQVAKNVGHWFFFFWNQLCSSSPHLNKFSLQMIPTFATSHKFWAKNKGKSMHQGILNNFMALK